MPPSWDARGGLDYVPQTMRDGIMRTFWLVATLALLLGCAPAAVISAPDMPASPWPAQVVGPENHALVLDGVS